MFAVKVGGLVLTGLGAWLLTTKALNVIDDVVKKHTEASKWKAYYNCWSSSLDAPNSIPVPPGYSMTERPRNTNSEIVYDPSGTDHSKDGTNAVKAEKDVANDIARTVVEASKTVVDSLLKKTKENTSEGLETQEEAKECVVGPSSHDDLLTDEKIVKYDENGKPIAGRYPYGKELEDPLYVDDISDGVKLVDEEGDDK